MPNRLNAPTRSVVRLINLACLAGALLIAAVPTWAAPAATDWGKIVTQSYDPGQQVTETHLANGLTILSKESHGAPVVYFSVWYKVGSRNELSGFTGLSHILEHMQFKGTRDLPPGAIDHLFQMNGGEINATTGTDRTEFHELIASDRLELAMRVEADRMEHSAFDPVQLRHEMVVVRSELEGDSNDPAYQLFEFSFLPAAFTSHPYHWPTLGWRSDVEAVASNRDVIYKYYRDHYMPNNAIVVMVGDFDTKKAVAMCQHYFGIYGPGKLEQHHITPEPPQLGERRVVLKRPGTVGQVVIGYHAPPLGAKDHYVMDVISQILSSGRSSRLYQDLVNQGIVESADAGNDDCKDPYLFTLNATDSAGVSNETVEKALEDEVVKLQTTMVSDDELSRAVNQIVASFTYNNDSVSSQASQIGEYAVILSYKYLDTYLDQIKKVTPADIQRVAKEYFTEDNRTVAYFDPQPLPPGVSSTPPVWVDNFGAAAPVTDPHQKAILAALEKKYNSGLSNVQPVSHVRPTRIVLPNGMVVIVEENHANHTIAFSGLTRAGGMYDPGDKYGVSDLTAEMLDRGTTSKSAIELAVTLDSIAADVEFNSGTETAGFDGECLSKDFGLTMSTFADELLHPAFPTDELERLRGEMLSGLEDARQETGGTTGAGEQAEIAFAQAMYPKGHPYWIPSIDEQEADLKTITQSDLQSFYSTYYRPDTTELVIVGDVNTATAIDTVKSLFGGWTNPASPRPTLNIPTIEAPVEAPSPQMISIPGTTQTSILWGFPCQLTRTSKDFYAATIMNYVLGGDTFGSRLGKFIRDEQGLAYSVSADIDAAHGAGPMTVFVGTNPANANRVVHDIRVVTAQYLKTGATPDEIRLAKEYLTGIGVLRLETNSGIAEQLIVGEDFNLGLDYIQKRSSYYEAVTLDQVNAAAHKYLHPDKATLVISGATPGK